MNGAQILGIFLVILVVIVICSSIRVVPQAHAYVIERLGTYNTTWSAGLHLKTPLIDKVAHRISMKEQVVDFAPQPVITKDNVTMRIDTVVFFQITDPKLFAYGVEKPIMAIENLTATTLRNIPPAAIQDAMEKQMKAERERREQILIAEGEKKSAILRAEGQKESLILSAEAEKQSAILRAEATKEATIRRAEGEAEAILKVQQANADGIKFLNEAAPDQAVLTLKSLEAFAKAADGKATKLIIPSEISGIAGLASSLTEIVTKNKES